MRRDPKMTGGKAPPVYADKMLREYSMKRPAAHSIGTEQEVRTNALPSDGRDRNDTA